MAVELSVSDKMLLTEGVGLWQPLPETFPIRLVGTIGIRSRDIGEPAGFHLRPTPGRCFARRRESERPRLPSRTRASFLCLLASVGEQTAPSGPISKKFTRGYCLAIVARRVHLVARTAAARPGIRRVCVGLVAIETRGHAPPIHSRLSGLAECAKLPANADFVTRIVFSTLTDCADCEIGGNRGFMQLHATDSREI